MTDFSGQQKKIFRKIFAHPPVPAGSSKPEDFILQYVLFEALVRLVGSYYRNRNAQKKKSNAHIRLNVTDVKRSFKYFSICVSDLLLYQLLDSSLTKKNMKSARNLRNALVHNWKAGDVEEVRSRYEALSSAFSQVIGAIKARVQ